MKKVLVLALLAAVVATPALAQKKKKKGKKGEMTALDSASYAFGVSFANNLKGQGIAELSSEMVAKAVDDIYANTGMMSEEQAKSFLVSYFAEQKRIQGEKAKQEGEDFLAENGKKDGVTTTASGLQYEVITEGGEDNKPAITDRVKVHYHGTLLDGTVFDSSVNRGQPATFAVNQVIRGWVEALQLMSVGDKWKLYIPYDLAYGARGTGSIKPFSMLMFEVELIDIEK